MNTVWIVLNFIHLHSLSSEPETTDQVQEAIEKGREDFYNYVDGWYTVKKNCRQEVVNLESTLKHPLFPDNAYLVEVPEFPLFLGVPMCELHRDILGLIEYILRASLFRYTLTLRNPALVKEDGRPLVSDAQLSRITKRLQARWQATIVDESMLNITPSFLELWSKCFGNAMLKCQAISSR